MSSFSTFEIVNSALKIQPHPISGLCCHLRMLFFQKVACGRSMQCVATRLWTQVKYFDQCHGSHLKHLLITIVRLRCTTKQELNLGWVPATTPLLYTMPNLWSADNPTDILCVSPINFLRHNLVQQLLSCWSWYLLIFGTTPKSPSSTYSTDYFLAPATQKYFLFH